MTITRKIPSPLSDEEAEARIENYIQSWTVFDVTPFVTLEAVRGVRQHGLPFYDAVVWAVTKLNQVPVILTEDGQHDRVIEGVRYRNPFHPDFDLAALGVWRYHRDVSGLPEAILLDLDDTIIDDTGSVVSSWNDACAEAARRCPELDAARLYEVNREHADWWWSDPARHREGRLNLRQTSREILEEALRRCGCDDPELASDIANHYRDLREERACVLPGAIEVVERLREAGVRLGMMTNGAAGAQRAKIERFGLAKHFDHIVIEGELGVGKPDRLVFDSLLRELRVDPAKTWAVGDNLEFDVLAPMELGIYGVWLDPAGRGCDGRRPPDRIVATLAQLFD